MYASLGRPTDGIMEEQGFWDLRDANRLEWRLFKVTIMRILKRGLDNKFGLRYKNQAGRGGAGSHRCQARKTAQAG